MSDVNATSPMISGSARSDSSKHLLSRRSESPQRPSKIARTDDLSDGEQRDSVASNTMSQNPRVQRYLVAVEYIGTRFSGSQQQLNCRTVVGALQEAFHKFIGQPVSIFCSSRTDAGVHALSNVCHVDVERISKRKPGEVLPPHEPAVVRRAVNHFLQKNEGDVMVIDVRCVPPDFHARYKAQERTYFYRLLSGPEPLSSFEKDRAWHVPEDLDLLAMQKACRVLVGCHDFSSFRAAGCQVVHHLLDVYLLGGKGKQLGCGLPEESIPTTLEFLLDQSSVSMGDFIILANSPIRTLDELCVSELLPTSYFPSMAERAQNNFTDENPLACSNKAEVPDSPSTSNHDRLDIFNGAGQGFGIRRRHRCFVVTARARAFLYHQVRLLVGVLKCVGTGDLTVSDVERILNAKSVTAASPMAPACGLYLGNVKYDLP